MMDVEEHRASTRRLTLKDGKAILSSSTLMNCIIRDLSEGGACLEFGGPTSLPPEFKLRVVAVRMEAPVELAWQRGYSAGVRFETPLR
jgi:hypothetical protein